MIVANEISSNGTINSTALSVREDDNAQHKFACILWEECSIVYECVKGYLQGAKYISTEHIALVLASYVSKLNIYYIYF